MALGYRHLHGIGVPKSCQDSVSYYTRVADKAVAALQGREGASTFVEKRRLSEMSEVPLPAQQHPHDCGP
jgi:SEL1 protein